MFNFDELKLIESSIKCAINEWGGDPDLDKLFFKMNRLKTYKVTVSYKYDEKDKKLVEYFYVKEDVDIWLAENPFFFNPIVERINQHSLSTIIGTTTPKEAEERLRAKGLDVERYAQETRDHARKMAGGFSPVDMEELLYLASLPDPDNVSSNILDRFED